MNGIVRNIRPSQIRDFDGLSFEERCLNIVDLEIGRIYPYADRFGIFFDNPDKTLTLSDLQTNKSYAEITDLTAQTYAGKNIAVAWSGGIDSSVIVSALHKNNIDFKVTIMPERCRAENPEMYDWVLANCDVIQLDDETHFNNLYDFVIAGGEVVSGDPADLLFPSIRYQLMPGTVARRNLYTRENGYGDNLILLNQSYPDENFYNNIKERLFDLSNQVGSYATIPENFASDVVRFFTDRLAKNNIDFRHYYQLHWLAQFTFRYAGHQQRVARIMRNRFAYYGREQYDVNFVQHDFFDTMEYQSWAWTNLDRTFNTQSTTALTQKMDAKEYIVDVTKLPSQLNLIKAPSL
jgi:hypothetical protein